MFDKWLIKNVDNSSIVVKRDDRTGDVIIGGTRHFRTMMEDIVTRYLCRDIPENIHSQRGRVRLIISKVRIEQWNFALTKWQEDYIAERVVRHGRVL